MPLPLWKQNGQSINEGGLQDEKGSAFVDGGGYSCSRDPHRNWSFRLAKPSCRSRRRTSNTDPVRSPNGLLMRCEM